MALDIINNGYVLSFIVVNSGIGSKVLSEAKKIGATGGTIFLGRGTVKNHILEILGLDEVKKEIVVIALESHIEDMVLDGLIKRFHMAKPNHGIIFSVDLTKIIGSGGKNEYVKSSIGGGRNGMEYEVIWTIVDRGAGQEVVDAATSAGARGATIINARGSGIHEKDMFFSMPIEPEKEIVMIIIKKEKTDDIVTAINKAMQIEEPGKGILFVMDVNRTAGLFREDDASK